MIIYTIHDSIAEYFFPPYMARNDAEASRMFVQSLGDTFPHRADFKLMSIGTFDQETGLLKATDLNMVLAGLSIPEHAGPQAIPPEIHMPGQIQKPRGSNTHDEEGKIL